LIGILTDPGIGGTFLTWSIHYLRGDINYFLVESEKEVRLTDNPLTGLNSHNFIPNQPNRGVDRGLQKLYQMHDQLKTMSDNSIIYLHNFDDQTDTITGVNFLSSQADKLLLVTGKKYPLYHSRYIRRGGGNWISSDKFSSDPDVVYKSFVTKFFLKSYQQFQDAGLTNIWDQREFIALNFDPYSKLFIEDCFDCSKNHYVLDIAEFYNSEDHISYIFNYLDIEINSDRYTQWKKVYQQWKKMHQQNMLFVIYFDKIINYIVKGYELNLDKFNLDIVQEATIQHELLYKHNLNLKTWQLEKFTNTKQLNQLLEPNFHQLTVTN
jgi:hypothetical protein